MLPFPSQAGRVALIAGLLVLGLTACGRRGPLEAPPSATAPVAGRSAETQAQIDAEAEAAEQGRTSGTFLPAPTPGGRGGSARTLPTRPNKPFFLDPLL
jgi:predicted small lipoprotein YifL